MKECFAEKQAAEIIERNFTPRFHKRLREKLANATTAAVVYTLVAGFIGVGAGLNFAEIALRKITRKDVYLGGLKL